ncbi:MAG: PQQ-binding-like beta-propeller repeat protein, partial [Planctomycetes bacterium]|nr:PQQ-binding-like beta-propeller repeat protein [Planctomycetota bacterium]
MFTVNKKILAGLLLVALAIVLSGCRKDENAPAGEQNETAVAIGGENWPIFRGGRNLLGVAQGQLPDKLQLVWKFKTPDAVMSSPVIDGGVVYVGSDDGSVYAIDAKSGKKVWSYQTEDAIEAPPTVVD